MYNRILNRPMFKRGGDVMDAKGTGITSGLDTPRQGYHRGRVVRPGGYNGKLEDIETSMDILSGKMGTNIDTLRAENIVTPEQKSGAFWTGVSQFGGAKTLAEAVMRGVEGQSKAIQPYEEAVAKKGLMLDEMELTSDLNIGMKGLDVQSQVLLHKMDNTSKEKIAEIASKATKWHGQKEYYDKKLADGDMSQADYDRQMQIINTGFNIEEAAVNFAKTQLANPNFYIDINDKQAVADFVRGIKALILSLRDAIRQGSAKGGRVGYQLGTNMQGVQPQQAGFNQPTEVGLNVDETIKTPEGTLQEDISVQEKIKPSVDMTYEEFRAKMPPEVDDDIVQLIYYNEDAFADFAQIKTQDEVYAFNNKWGVTLMLPFNTEIT
tara:strand:+ start:384 stop:1520 length:1137 start_codon:yes stop_codon:yes gene_type:complete